MTRRRIVLSILGTLVLGGVLVWRYQSEVIGGLAHWYLGRMASAESAAGDLTRRRQVVGTMSRMLLMPVPPDGQIPELFELVTLLSSRTARGEISLGWSAYIYTSYVRDMARDRPSGVPARTPVEVAAELERYVTFFAIQKRPDVAGVTFADLLGTGGESYTLEEIEQADREGRQLPLK